MLLLGLPLLGWPLSHCPAAPLPALLLPLRSAPTSAPCPPLLLPSAPPSATAAPPQEALGVPEPGQRYASCSDAVAAALSGDVMRSVKGLLPDLLAAFPLLLYQGATPGCR